MNKEQLQMTISEVIGDYLLETVHKTVYGKKNIEIAKKHLESGGSILVYFNHFAKLDAILYGRIINENLAPYNNVAAVTAFKHVDSKRGILNRGQKALIEDWEKIYGLTSIPIIQTKDKNHYNDADISNRKSLTKIKNFLREPGHVVAFAPEGTRSSTDELLRAEPGFQLLLKAGGDNVLALPFAGIHKTILPGRRTTVIIGRPISLKELKTKQLLNPNLSITDIAMYHLAALIPLQNRGFYK